MALVNTVSPDKAEGSIKEAYEMFMKNIGMIPRPMEMQVFQFDQNCMIG